MQTGLTMPTYLAEICKSQDFPKREHSTDTSWAEWSPASLIRMPVFSISSTRKNVEGEVAGCVEIWPKLPQAMHSTGMQLRAYHINSFVSINHPVPTAAGRNFPMNVASTDFSSLLSRPAPFQALPIVFPLRFHIFVRAETKFDGRVVRVRATRPRARQIDPLACKNKIPVNAFKTTQDVWRLIIYRCSSLLNLASGERNTGFRET